jgi:hypothetical protein
MKETLEQKKVREAENTLDLGNDRWSKLFGKMQNHAD